MLLLLIMWEASSATSDPLTWLINLGVAGIVIVLLITGKLRTGKEVEHLLEEIASLKQVLSATQAQLTGHALPALAKSAEALESIPTNQLATVQEQVMELSKQVSKLAEKM